MHISPNRLKTAFCSLVLMLVFGIISSVSIAQDDAAEAHKATLKRIYTEAFNEGNLDMLDEIYAADYVNSGLGDDMTLEDFKATLAMWRSALPDFEATVEILIAEDEWAASRVTLRGTFENDWTMGDTVVTPNGESIEWTLHVLHHFNEDNQIVEDFTTLDYLDLLTQLDASPLPVFLAGALGTREHTEVVVEAPEFDVTSDMLQANEAAFTHVIEDAINNGDLTAVDTYLIEDYLTHEPFGNFSRDAFRGIIAGFRAAVPDLHVDIEAVVTEGDWLAARLIYLGTFSNGVSSGDMTVDATNKDIRFIINVFVLFGEDSIALEDYKEYNPVGWLRQLGLLPE